MALYKCQRCKKKKALSSMDFTSLDKHMRGLCAACKWEQNHEKVKQLPRRWKSA